MTTPTPRTPIAGLHHVTAVASDPQANLDFYAGVLGLRLVKRTVNFDDPGTYHFYFGDETGTPGTIFTTFPWPGAARGRQGAGAPTATAFLVPPGALEWWSDRLKAARVTLGELTTRLGERALPFEDHDGMRLELVESASAASLPRWSAGLAEGVAIRGFHSATLTVHQLGPTASLLTEAFGLRPAGSQGARHRFSSPGPQPGMHVDVIEAPSEAPSRLGAGVVHHVAFRAANDADQAGWQRLLSERGVGVTPVRDRNYFRSIYFREPGGVLFEIATDGPGFPDDEPVASLGGALKLPPQFEPHRARIEARVPAITVPTPREL